MRPLLPVWAAMWASIGCEPSELSEGRRHWERFFDASETRSRNIEHQQQIEAAGAFVCLLRTALFVNEKPDNVASGNCLNLSGIKWRKAISKIAILTKCFVICSTSGIRLKNIPGENPSIRSSMTPLVPASETPHSGHRPPSASGFSSQSPAKTAGNDDTLNADQTWNGFPNQRIRHPGNPA